MANSNQPLPAQTNAAPEPCPTPLSTKAVFQSFEQESVRWEIPGSAGVLSGWTVGDGPPLYFLNGLEGRSDLFRLLAWLLREEFRCVLYDPLPPGKIEKADRSNPAAVPEVQQLFAVADMHQDETFTVYGTGFGGWVALAAMLADGPRIPRAILQGTYARRRFSLIERLLLRFVARKSDRPLQSIKNWRRVIEQNHRHWFPPFDPHRWDIFQHIAGEVPVRRLAQRLTQLQSVPLHHRLGEISTPILCLKTEGEGQVLRQRREELEQNLPHCQVETLRDTGLIPHWTHPHRIAKLVRQFLEAPHPAKTV